MAAALAIETTYRWDSDGDQSAPLLRTWSCAAALLSSSTTLSAILRPIRSHTGLRYGASKLVSHAPLTRVPRFIDPLASPTSLHHPMHASAAFSSSRRS